MLDGRYDPAFALYFCQNDDKAPADWPKALVTFGFLGIAALGGAIAFFLLIP